MTRSSTDRAQRRSKIDSGVLESNHGRPEFASVARLVFPLVPLDARSVYTGSQEVTGSTPSDLPSHLLHHDELSEDAMTRRIGLAVCAALLVWQSSGDAPESSSPVVAALPAVPGA